MRRHLILRETAAAALARETLGKLKLLHGTPLFLGKTDSCGLAIRQPHTHDALYCGKHPRLTQATSR